MPLGPAEDVIIGGQGDLIAAMVRTIIQLTAEQAARLDRAAVDTSALLAYLDRDALRHAEIVAAMYAAFAERKALTHNYVLLETEALTRRWLGAVVARRLLEDVAPILEVAWVDASTERRPLACLPHPGGARRSSTR